MLISPCVPCIPCATDVAARSLDGCAAQVAAHAARVRAVRELAAPLPALCRRGDRHDPRPLGPHAPRGLPAVRLHATRPPPSCTDPLSVPPACAMQLLRACAVCSPAAQVYLPSDFIVVATTMRPCIFFVARGHVQIISASVRSASGYRFQVVSPSQQCYFNDLTLFITRSQQVCAPCSHLRFCRRPSLCRPRADPLIHLTSCALSCSDQPDDCSRAHTRRHVRAHARGV